MPPKPAPPKASKKAETKKKEKVIEDKTFGLKNKKGAKQQKFIQHVEKQVKAGGAYPSGAPKKVDPKKDNKDELDMKDIFKPVTQQQKVAKGADPKSVLCAFFKQGQCTKGDKCKFSHDLTIERKAEKRSLYDDAQMEENDTMDNWDDEMLKDVIEKKHGAEKSKPKTDIICKYFLDAVEKAKYGWFWECPNGQECHYKHALPPGFVLKRDKKNESKGSEMSLEDLIEKERAALGSNLTKVTLESFIAWKKRKIEEKKKALAAAEEKKRTDYKAGRSIGLSGRDMFTFNPNMAMDEELEDGDAAWEYSREDSENEDEDIQYRELDAVPWDLEDMDPETASKLAEMKLKDEVPIDENLFLEDDDLDDEELDD